MTKETIFALAVLVSLGCAKKEPPPAAPPEVLVTAATREDVPVFGEWIGTMDGAVNATIRPKVEGYLRRQTYKEGQFVRAGDLLFEVDPRQFRASLAQANGALGQAEAQLAKATRDVERFTPLAAERAISQQELDDAVSARRNAKAAVDSARATVEEVSLNLGWTRVTSPIAGIVGIANAQVGDLVGTQTVMTTVSTVDPIRVTFGISEREYMRYAVQINRANYATTVRGPFLQLVLDDGTTYAHEGRVLVTDREVGVKTGTMTLKGVFPNPGNILRPGQYARVRANLDTRVGAIVVPQKAVSELQGGFRVAVVGPDGKAEFRAVEPGERVRSLWVIEKGLQEGEKVIVAGLQLVRPGMTVTAKLAPAEGSLASAAGAAR